jgi:hypothetical protein
VKKEREDGKMEMQRIQNKIAKKPSMGLRARTCAFSFE